METTHIVVKKADIEKYCTEKQKEQLEEILTSVMKGRTQEGKIGVNHYCICNMDEPYAQTVLSILRYEEATGEKFGGIEIRSSEQQEAHESRMRYSSDDNFFDEEYS
jgi:hypothetical protein